jgi:hypothetical protein
MAQKSLDISIREYDNITLEEIITIKKKNYSDEVLSIAHDELTIRNLKKIDPLQQIDLIRNLSNNQISFIIEKSKDKYPDNLYLIAHQEYIKRDLEIQEWYYLDNNVTKGPLKFSELRKLALDGLIMTYSFVFKEGLQNWITANYVPGLFNQEPTNINIPPPPIIIPNTGKIGQPINPFDNKKEENQDEKLGDGAAILSFLIPLIGIILFLIYDNKKGKKAGSLALWGIIISVILSILIHSI